MQPNRMESEHMEPIHPGLPAEAATPLPKKRRRAALVALMAGGALVALTVGASVVAGASPAPAGPGAGAGGIVVVGGPVPGGSPPDLEKVEAAFTKFTACMREHGIDMPEPVKVEGSATLDSSGPVVNVAPPIGVVAAPESLSLDPTSKEFLAADEACRPILEDAGIQSGTIATMGPVEGSVEGPVATGAAGLVVVGGPGPGGSPADFAKIEAAFTKYAGCMREHGIDMPDPVKVEGSATLDDGAAVTLTPPTGSALALTFDPAGKDFVAADAACKSILEDAGITSGTGTIQGPVPAAPPGQ